MLTRPFLGLMSLALLSAAPVCVARQAAAPQSAAPSSAQELDRAARLGAEKRYDEAIQVYNEGLEKAIAARNERMIGLLYVNRGVAYSNLQKFDLSREDETEAIKHFKTAGDTHNVCMTFRNLASVYYNLNRYSDALDCQRKAFDMLCKEYEQTHLPHTKDLLFLDMPNLDALYFKSGRLADALQPPNYFETALHLREELCNDENRAQLLGESLFNLGVANTSVRRTDEAMAYYLKALPYTTQAKDREREADIDYDVGIAYFIQGDLDRAEFYLDQARKLYHALSQENNDPDLAANQALKESGTLDMLANIELTRAGISQNSTFFQQAEEQYGQAAAARNRGKNAEDATYLANMGDLRLAQRDGRKAKQYFAQALRLLEADKTSADYAEVLSSQGQALLLENNLAEAERVFKQALAAPGMQGNRWTQAQTYALLGDACLRQKHPADAVAAFHKARDFYEATDHGIVNPAQIADLQTLHFKRLYGQHAAALAALGRGQEALAEVERGRTRGLTRQATYNNVDFQRALAKSAPEWKRLREKYAALNTGADGNSSIKTPPEDEKTPDATQKAQLRILRDSAEAELSALKSKLCREHSDFLRLSGEEPLDWKRLLALSRANPDTLYLEWSLVDDKHTLLFAISRGQVRVVPLAYGAGVLTPAIQQWRDSIEATLKPRDGSLSNAELSRLLQLEHSEPAKAQALYKLLFSPLEQGMGGGRQALQPYKHLALVADGPLLDVPFAALCSREGRRLIEDHALSYDFSLGSLLWPRVSTKPQLRLCYMAYTGGAAGNNEQPAAASGQGKARALPHIRRATQQVARMLPKIDSEDVSGRPKWEILDWMKTATILHFGTHGYFDAGNGLRSYLRLAPSAASGEAEQCLWAREVANESLMAELAVLAACDSGRGELRGGEGIVGLAWAFRAGGCRSITAAQWPVDDKPTGAWIVNFYDALLRGKMRKDDALQQAMLKTMRNPAYASPCYWSAFQMYGDPSPLQFGPRPRFRTISKTLVRKEPGKHKTG